jgi:hypothetical protein
MADDKAPKRKVEPRPYTVLIGDSGAGPFSPHSIQTARTKKEAKQQAVAGDEALVARIDDGETVFLEAIASWEPTPVFIERPAPKIKF